MSKGVFIHNPGTHYDDDVATRYHFPKQYLKRVQAIIGDEVLYYQSGKKGGYIGTAHVLSVEPDLSRDNHYYANIAPRSFIPFPRAVPFRINGKIANSFISNQDGSPNRGKQVWAVRPISEEDFMKIVALAATSPAELPREKEFELGEAAQTEFVYDAERPTVEVILNKKVRSRLFRDSVIGAYDKRCALTSMRFINGGGRAEVQAAHIKAVEHNGPDIINNGLALSGTVHWMFDRGLVAVSDEYEIMISRKVNNFDEVNHLINKDQKLNLPEREDYWPHKKYLEWHRDHHEFQVAS